VAGCYEQDRDQGRGVMNRTETVAGSYEQGRDKSFIKGRASCTNIGSIF
jgi:hypothetical protein